MTEWDTLRYDVRVRTRMLNSRLLTQDDLERHLAELGDVEGNAETIASAQPALASRGSRESQPVAPQPPLVERVEPPMVGADVEAVQSSTPDLEPAAGSVPQSPDPSWPGEEPS
jgi:hypothetical protein